MQMVAKRLLQFLSVILLFSTIGCTAHVEIHEPISTSKPMLNKLESYDPPERKVTIAVYKFTDLTGQRKPSETLALLSSAVTQGGDIWLMQALKRCLLYTSPSPRD